MEQLTPPTPRFPRSTVEMLEELLVLVAPSWHTRWASHIPPAYLGTVREYDQLTPTYTTLPTKHGEDGACMIVLLLHPVV